MTLTRAVAMLALTLAGLSEAVAQFPPPPGQAAPAQSSPFPPPPGQAAPPAKSSPFPSPPGQAAPAARSSPFPAPPGPGQQASPGAPPAQAQPSPFPTPGQGGAFPQSGSFTPSAPRSAAPPPGQPPAVCLQFPPIRDQAEKDGNAIKIAGDRKATREEVCALMTKFVSSEAKMVNFLVANRETCGVPPDAIKHVRGQHAKSQDMRKKICSGGGGGPAAGPSLSDALGGPALPDEKPKPGRGTFDTLTGSPLAR